MARAPLLDEVMDHADAAGEMLKGALEHPPPEQEVVLHTGSF